MREEKRKLIKFKDIAELGAYLGIFLIMQFLANTQAPNLYAAILSNVMFIAIPFVLYGILLRFRKQNIEERFTTLQLTGLGISVFFIGSIICSIITYIYCQYIDVTLIARLIQSSLDIFSTQADPDTFVMMQKGYKAFQDYPGIAPIAYSLSTFVMNMTYGVFISLLIGWLVGRQKFQ